PIPCRLQAQAASIRTRVWARPASTIALPLPPMAPPRPEIPFLQKLKDSTLVFDGAMGSLLLERGIFVTQNFEQLNVARPDIVKKIHADYVAAGAQVIETNTF